MDLIKLVNIQSDLHCIGRRYYNLALKDKTLAEPSILSFFKKPGAKIGSLDIQGCIFRFGLLESIMKLCEGLCSLSLQHSKTSSYFFTFETFSIMHPSVTYLKFTLPPVKPYDYFHRIFSVFPNLKQLEIITHEGSYEYWDEKLGNDPKKYSPCFDGTNIMKLGDNLESLKLRIPLYITRKSNFFAALPQ